MTLQQTIGGHFFGGVVEGFYGMPWNARQRHRLFQWLTETGLNAYLYAPKDDLKHRARWRELYAEMQFAEISALVRDCQHHGLRFIYAIAPGLDIRFSAAADRKHLLEKLGQLRDLGVRDFALLFDDIPLILPDADRAEFGTTARAQAACANEVWKWLGENGKLLLCPTVYCGRMAAPDVAGDGYLRELGQSLAPGIDVLWTGPDIVSESITAASVAELRAVLGRKPVIWDNLYANDYDPHRVFIGPYAGREPELLEEVGGLFLNPNCQFELDYVPVRVFGSFCGLRTVAAQVDVRTIESVTHAKAMESWRDAFVESGRVELTVAQLGWLVECCWLPHHTGPNAAVLLGLLRRGVSEPELLAESEWTQIQGFIEALISMQEKLVRIDNRDLLFALYATAWELKEEALVLRAFLEWRRGVSNAQVGFDCRDCRPGTFRGGFLAALRELAVMGEDGRIRGK